MASETLCRCGLPHSEGRRVRFTCDVCRAVFEEAGPYVPGLAGALELAHRWRLDFCRDCLEHLIARAPEDTRARLRAQAFDESRAL